MSENKFIQFTRRFWPPSSKDIADQCGPVQLRTMRLMLLDDDPFMRSVFRALVIDAFNIEMIEAETIAQAKNLASLSHPIDIMVLDQKLVNGEGVEFYAYIARQWPLTRVVFLTGYDSPELRSKVEKIGPAPVYSKDAFRQPHFMENLFLQLGMVKRFQLEQE